MPSILASPNASRPEKAPPEAADVYKIAMRVCVSFGRYHFEITSTAPGRKPALEIVSIGETPLDMVRVNYSKSPNKKRITTRPAKF
jgi:hypothetical protein